MAGILPFGAMFIELFFIFSVSTTKFISMSNHLFCQLFVYLLSSVCKFILRNFPEIVQNVRQLTDLTFKCMSPPTGHLGESVLLPLWLPVSGLHHLGGVLLSDQHRHGLFPALCRGKCV